MGRGQVLARELRNEAQALKALELKRKEYEARKALIIEDRQGPSHRQPCQRDRACPAPHRKQEERRQRAA